MKAVLKHRKVSTYYDQERLKTFQWHFLSLIMIQISIMALFRLRTETYVAKNFFFAVFLHKMVE